MDDGKLQEVLISIEGSNEVLKQAWKNHTPQISEKMEVVGKPVGERYLRYQYEQPKDVKRTNMLKQVKQYLGGSYLTRLQIGETIFTDLRYFRSLFMDAARKPLRVSEIFFQINDLWSDVQKAFFARDDVKLEQLIIRLQTEINRLRRAIAIDQEFNPKGAYASSVKSRFLRLKIFRLFRGK